MPLLRFIFALFLLGAAALPLAAAEIEISAPGREQIPLAVTRLLPTEGVIRSEIASAFDAALCDDLDLAGLFSLIPPAAFLSDAGRLGLASTQVDFNQWRQLGTTALIKGGYALKGNELVVEVRLYDVSGRRLLSGRRYRGQPGDERRMAHAFADQVLASLTGREGCFSSRIAFVSGRSGQKELYLMEIDGSQPERLTNHQSIVLNPDLAPQGKEVIFTSYRQGQPELYRKEIYSGREARISARSGVNISARYRPDGGEIAMTLSIDGNPELYLVGTDGSIHRRLTNDWAIDVDPSWSPNSDRLVFTSDRLGNPHLFVLDLVAGTQRQLTVNGKYNATPAWSPLGDRIVFSRLEAKQFDIYTIRPDGSDEQRLTFGPGNKEHPRWSPDGRFLVFTSDQGGERSIYIMRADGSGIRKVSPAGWIAQHPVWSGRW
jgi:TolB protein